MSVKNTLANIDLEQAYLSAIRFERAAFSSTLEGYLDPNEVQMESDSVFQNLIFCIRVTGLLDAFVYT